MKVYFSHGKESGPWGFKIKRLAEIAAQQNFQVESVDYTDLMDPDLRVDRLLERLTTEHDEILLVGSSMGGYVSLVASESVALDILQFERMRDVQPGEAVFIENSGALHCREFAGEVRHTPCIFEFVYFARPDSIIDNHNH